MRVKRTSVIACPSVAIYEYARPIEVTVRAHRYTSAISDGGRNCKARFIELQPLTPHYTISPSNRCISTSGVERSNKIDEVQA
jgi:hypothetical protein